MVLNLLEWSLKVVIAAFVLLVVSLLLHFVFNAVIGGLFHGPQITFIESAIFAALVAIAVGNWSFTVLRART